jgi:hypothetical protein
MHLARKMHWSLSAYLSQLLYRGFMASLLKQFLLEEKQDDKQTWSIVCNLIKALVISYAILNQWLAKSQNGFGLCSKSYGDLFVRFHCCSSSLAVLFSAAMNSSQQSNGLRMRLESDGS